MSQKHYLIFSILLLGNIILPQVIYDPNLIGYYPLDGNGNDLSGYQNHGILEGATPEEDQNGNPNSCLFFDGINDQITFEQNNTLSVTGDLTITCWIYVEALPQGGMVYPIMIYAEWGETETTNTLYSLSVININNELFSRTVHEYSSGINQEFISPTPIPILTWTHLAIVRDATAQTYTFFINGTVDTTFSYANNPTGGSSASPRISHSPTTNKWYYGALDEVSVWDRTLTPDQLNTIYSNGVLYCALPGDVNYDNMRDIFDVLLIVDYVLGRNPQPFSTICADLNNDTQINILDVINLIMIIL